MAAAGRPVSELYPLGGAVSLESTLSTCQEGPTDAASEICQESSATPSHLSSQKAGGELGDRKQSPSEHCVPSPALSCPHTVVESHTPTHHNKIVLNVISDNPQADRGVWSTKPTSLPISTSQSGKQGVPPPAPDSGTSGLAYHGGNTGIQEAEGHSMLACKQPMQLHQCNIITTICRGSNSGEDGLQQPPSRCVCISSSKAAAKVEGFGEEDHLPAKCDEALSYGSYIHHTNFEDTFAAYCHPQPIPAPSQVQPRHIESSCVSQCAVVPSLASFNHLSLPRLMSSVSETGLDAKHLLRGCSLSCPWITALPPGAGPQFQKHFDLEQCCSSPVDHVSTMTREMGTMTTHKELRDVGVQTGQTDTPHVFPQVCLAKESKSETSCSLTLNTDSDDGKKQGGAPKSPVKEVKWDAEGMTWEVYGASVDPEELGLAIQRHLELQIKETASRAAKLSRQNTNTSRQSENTGCQRKRSRMMSSIRTPVCCARTTSAVD